MGSRILYQELAATVQARLNCISHHNVEWFEKHTEHIRQLIRDFMPSGSGWDHGTTLDLENSHADKLVFYGQFHHMDQNGFYDGWTDHTVTVTPSLASRFHIRISGRNRNDIKEYLTDTFSFALEIPIVWRADEGQPTEGTMFPGKWVMEDNQ